MGRSTVRLFERYLQHRTGSAPGTGGGPRAARTAVTQPARTQRAVVQTGYGDAGAVLELSTTHPVPEPGPGQVQIAVHAAAVNPIDWQMIEGNRRMISARTFPFVPLFDLAGVVTAVGEGVTRFAVGDAVHADDEKGGGGASEVVVVDERLVSAQPAGLDHAEAAAVPLAAQTALLALERGGVGPGSRVVVVGASGGVGSFAVQIARALGAAQVIGVASGANAGHVRSLGADEVVDRTRATLSEALGDRRVDVVLDCVGGREQWLQARAVLVPRGRFVTIARDEDGEVTLPSVVRLLAVFAARRARSAVGRRIAYVPVFLDASHELLDRVDALIASGAVVVPVTTRHPFTLEGVLELLAHSRSGRAVGKSVLEVVPAGAPPVVAPVPATRPVHDRP